MDPSAFCWIARSGSPATPARNGAAATRAPAGAPAGAAAGAAGAGGEAAGGGGGGGAVANNDAAGMNFGMPHRDFTCLQSLDKDGATLPRAAHDTTLRLTTTLTGGFDSLQVPLRS